MVPLMRRLTRSGERVVEDGALVDLRDVEPSPAAAVVGPSARLLALIDQHLRLAVAHAVVVRFGDSHGAVIGESQQPLVGDGESELGVERPLE